MSTPTTLVAGRYRLVKMLGAGGMGVVWQAWDERLERQVALKMLRTQSELTDAERELATNRAMREARITAGLHHPYAVTVYDVVEHEGRPCIVMQLIESTPLSDLLREHGTLSPEAAARIGAQASAALAAAHKMRIVHRDVKPGNILITEDGSAMISDFGISHALGDATITATGMIHGTPAYLAPEVARGKPSSFASDVFSLGSTLYAVLEGQPPFGADKNAIALLHRVARGGYPPPKRAGALKPLLRGMLSADPKRRPTMAAIAVSLAQVAAGGTSGTRPRLASAASAQDSSLLDAETIGLPVDVPSRLAYETPAASSPSASAAPAEVIADAAAPTEVIVDAKAPTEAIADAAAPAEGIADAAAPAEGISEAEAPTEGNAESAAPTEVIADAAAPTEAIAAEARTEVIAAEAPTADAITRPKATTAETVPLPADETDAALDELGFTGRTTPLDQPTRYEPPTAETEPLWKAASAAAAGSIGVPAHPKSGERMSPPPPDEPRPQPAPTRRRRRGGVIVGAMVLVGALVVAGILLFNPFRQVSEDTAAPAIEQTSEPSSTSVVPSPSPSPTPVVSPSPTPEVVTPSPPTPEERVVQTITDYYATVSSNRDSAWSSMTDDYQQNHAGGRENYDSFWDAIAEVQVTDVTASAPDAGQATLTYYYRDGGVSQEVTAFQFVDDGGVLKIAATDVLSYTDL